MCAWDVCGGDRPGRRNWGGEAGVVPSNSNAAPAVVGEAQLVAAATASDAVILLLGLPWLWDVTSESEGAGEGPVAAAAVFEPA